MKLFTVLLVFPMLAPAAQPGPSPGETAGPKDKTHASSVQETEAGPAATSATQDAKNDGAAYSDLDYAWDEFNHRGKTTWACRGAQTGQFVSESLCAAQPKRDAHWPGKQVPANWDGTTRR